MAEIRPTTPFGRTTFCDDIREEVGGKVSIIGSYVGTMFVSGELPFILPKLCFLVEYQEARNANSPPIALQIYVPGDEEGHPAFAIDFPTPPNELASDPFLGDDSYISLRVPLILAPFEIRAEGLIKVRMKRGDDYVTLGSIAVRSAPNQTSDG